MDYPAMRKTACCVLVSVITLTTSVRAQQRASTPETAGMCVSPSPFDFANGPRWTGWIPDLGNTRFQNTAQAGMTAADVPKLKLRWAFGFPSSTGAYSMPTFAGGRLFVGSQDGTVYSLDARTGCIVWQFKAAGGVRAAVVLDGNTAYF